MAKAKNLIDFSADELLRELRTREAKHKAVEKAKLEKDSKIGKAKFEAIEKDTALTSDEALKDFDTPALVKALRAAQYVIYGTDDRKDLYRVTDKAVLTDADSVVCIFNAADVVDNNDGTSTLQTRNFGTAHQLCPREPFRNQPSGGFCSGFLVATDIIATAGH